MVLSTLQSVGSPNFLLISQLQEPLHILSVVATPIRREEVSKEALYKKLNRSYS